MPAYSAGQCVYVCVSKLENFPSVEFTDVVCSGTGSGSSAKPPDQNDKNMAWHAGVKTSSASFLAKNVKQ